MGNAVTCCTVRDGDSHAKELPESPRDTSYEDQKMRHESWCSIPDVAEEHWVFFECEDDDALEELPAPGVMKKLSGGQSPNGTRKRVQRGSTWYSLRPQAYSSPFEMVPENSSTWSDRRDSDYQPLLEEPCPFEGSVDRVSKDVIEYWRGREKSDSSTDAKLNQQLEEGFPELDEWTSRDNVRRYLRAMHGNEREATQLLIKALTYRVLKRDLFNSLVCDVVVDCRVIGRDRFRRPAVYMCAHSQRSPLKEVAPQMLLAFEAAVRLCQSDGQICLILDMHKFTPSLNMDGGTIKELGSAFGSVFAERFNFIMLVDFSFLAQGVWSMGKGLLSDSTQKKIAFVSEKKARGIAKEKFSDATGERILASFDINRDRASTQEEREAHALRTSICDVPLGAARPASFSVSA